eukprot:4905306-Heterocapsa_arctica.AAC.1
MVQEVAGAGAPRVRRRAAHVPPQAADEFGGQSPSLAGLGRLCWLGEELLRSVFCSVGPRVCFLRACARFVAGFWRGGSSRALVDCHRGINVKRRAHAPQWLGDWA